uniref:Uncharacterized protein n=1 Tax=Tanacetum cinerariifolium TaxID=118510 RepID=A0A699I7N7_TANCI|nr:hypothetical protein [Tanacetum cinerariifolium]
MRIFPITLTGAAKRWVDRHPPRTVNSSDLKKPLSKGTVHHQRLPSSLKKSVTSSRKETIHYTNLRSGCQIYGGAHLDKDFPLNEEIESVKEVKYEEFGRPFPNNNRNDGRFNREGYEQPSSRERSPSVTEIINKYMEEASKRHAEQDEWLKKFYQNKEKQETDNSRMIEALAALEAILKIKKNLKKNSKV